MTFEDVAQQYFDPLAHAQRLVLRYLCEILLRGTYTMLPASVTIDPIRTLTLFINPSFYAEKTCKIPLLTKSKNAWQNGSLPAKNFS
jgi:hypothetical protein